LRSLPPCPRSEYLPSRCRGRRSRKLVTQPDHLSEITCLQNFGGLLTLQEIGPQSGLNELSKRIIPNWKSKHDYVLDFRAFEPIDRTPGIFDKGPRAMESRKTSWSAVEPEGLTRKLGIFRSKRARVTSRKRTRSLPPLREEAHLTERIIEHVRRDRKYPQFCLSFLNLRHPDNGAG